MVGEKNRDADTIPAVPKPTHRPSQLTEFNVSGVRRAVVGQPLGAGCEAHAEMCRAVERGDCQLLVDHDNDDGTRLQWSAWFVQSDVIFQSWLQARSGAWSRGPSFLLGPEQASRLAARIVRVP